MSHWTGPRHKCPIEFARGALYEEFVSAKNDYVEGDRDRRGVQQRSV